MMMDDDNDDGDDDDDDEADLPLSACDFWVRPVQSLDQAHHEAKRGGDDDGQEDVEPDP